MTMAALAVIPIIGKVLDRVLPDKQANDAAKAALASSELQGEIQAVIAQIQVNQVEAASNSVFVAGWRPFVGWICGCAYAYAFILQPFLQFALVAFKVNFDSTKLPTLNLAELSYVLMGMLGLGVMRSYDKTKGAGNGH
jgi:ABC-type glycerol-3-phosphate transport system permease component